MHKIDPLLQAQVDAQLLEQGAFTALEFLFSVGRLLYDDYESWRRRELDNLDGVLMGDHDKIRAQLDAAAGYARSIGLVEQAQEFFAWHAAGSNNDKPLRISADAQLQRLIAARFVPAQSVPQMDLFFDNPIATLTTGIVRALCSGNAGEAQRQLDRLYLQAPNHADLAAFDLLLAALQRLNRPVEDAGGELDFLLEITPTAKRLLGARARDLLAPLWRQLAAALSGVAFRTDHPTLHRSFALSQAQDWSGVSECVLEEPQWWLHAPLCLRLAHSSFYQQRRIEALMAWCHLCWRTPQQAAQLLDQCRHPGIVALWQQFMDGEDSAVGEPALGAADFPAWLLLNEPGLALQLAAELPAGNTPGEEHYRCVHRWIQARRAQRREEEISLRKWLQAAQPALFRYLKRIV